MARFIEYNYKQQTMLAINFEEQLQPGTFEHAIHYLIDNKLDLSVFYPKFKNDETGRPGYDPAILLKIVLFAYSKGIKSSREIEWCCQNNIIFKALSCDTTPHFTTIADFISSCSEEIENIFEQVLLICHEQGLLGNELFAIDGCKQPSNASKQWSGTFKELEEKRAKIKRQIRHHLKEHETLDANESRDEARLKRSKQAIETLEKSSKKIEDFLKKSEPRMGKGKQRKEVKSNITDNESAKMTTSKGTIQGYNGVAAVDKKHQIVIDAQAFGEGQEQHTLQPIIEKIKERYRRLNISEDIFWCMRNPESANSRKGSGRQVSFILEGKTKPKYIDWMRRRIDSQFGKYIYSHRMSVVEPVFANLSVNKGLNRFSLRGLKKVSGQWKLYCLVQNIEKLMNFGVVTA